MSGSKPFTTRTGVILAIVAPRDWQSAMAERWERRRRSRPLVPGRLEPVPVRTWRRRQILGLLLALPFLVANAVWSGSTAAILAAALYVVFFGLAEWLWRRYLRPPGG